MPRESMRERASAPPRERQILTGGQLWVGNSVRNFDEVGNSDVW